MIKKNNEFKLLWDEPENIRTDVLETFSYSGEKQTIRYVTNEFSAVCPFSGLPDIATLEITYIPLDKCLELKSLKLYFVSYRNIGIFQEHATSRIYRDLYDCLYPEYLKVVSKYATRGGIDSVCEISSDQ
jgi:7-cyano-7-deazaguanine reductase